MSGYFWVRKQSYSNKQNPQAYPSIVKRGGGSRERELKVEENFWWGADFLVVYLHVDTQEAMGA